MRLTSFLLLAACLHVAAKSNSQSVTFSGEKVPLKKVFTAVEKQTGFFVFYNREMLNGANAVTVTAKDMALTDFLALLFKDQPLNFRIEGKTIVLSRKSLEKIIDAEAIEEKAASTPINGRVTDSTGAPLAGASVKVKGTSKGASTNVKGEFIIDANEGDILIISFVGYQQQEVRITNTSALIVFLKQATSVLDETVITAYSTTTKRYSTGSISSITSKQIENKPITNPLLALQAEVPGIVINQTSGFANSGVAVYVRGLNSFNKGIDPFYVIDGVPYTSQLLPSINTTPGLSRLTGVNPGGGAQAGNPLNFINPDDIESISVLKDADATSVYGSRAANGAIIITTKKGKAGQTRVSFNIQHGIGKVNRFMDLLNTKQYLEMRHEALKNDGLTLGATDYDLNGTWDTTRYTDWQKVLLGGTSKFTDIQTSASGGNENLQYLIGLNYHKETTVYPTDNNDQKASVHFSVNNFSNNRRLQLQLSGSYMLDNNRLPRANLATIALNLSPVAPALYNPDGSLNWEVHNETSTWTNPLNFTVSESGVKTSNLVSNFLVNYLLAPGLNIKVNTGYTNMQTNEIQLTPLGYFAPERRPTATRNAYYGNGNINSWILEPQLNYNRKFGNGSLNALIGGTVQQSNSNQVLLFGSGYGTDLLLKNPQSAASLSSYSTINTIYKYNAVFGIINYRLKDRYIINLSARRDGSSRFGSENMFQNFGSIAGAWIFSAEPWMQPSQSFLSFGKLRASFGTTGNDQIGDYQFLNSYTSNNVSVAYQGIVALIPIGIPNPNLQWEETRKLDMGINLGFLHDDILLDVAYYRNRSSNQLLSYKLPNITGATSYTRNLPATIQNSGLEISLRTNNIKRKSFSWTSSINISIVRNKLVSFPGLAASSYADSYMEGQTMSGFKAYRYLGVNTQTGEYQFADAKGDPTSNPDYSLDRQVFMNLLPTFYGGLNNEISFKNFQLNVLVQFSRQVVQNGFPGFGSGPGSFYSTGGNQPAYVMDRWKAPGDNATVQKFSTSYNTPFGSVGVSDGNYEKTWYARVKNVSLGYNLPVAWMKATKLQAGKVFVNAQNLLTFTNYKGWDPESGNSTIPPLRVIVLGVNVTL